MDREDALARIAAAIEAGLRQYLEATRKSPAPAPDDPDQQEAVKGFQMHNNEARRAVELHERLRAFLLAEMPHESPAAIAGALMYELASLAATVARSEPEAQGLIRGWVDTAVLQIRKFGIGAPHP